MALNKSVKHTPGSRSGYLPELTASSAKKTNFFLPVRIKVTPTNNCPLSDGKKNTSRLLQPVLIKDLLSSHKDKNNSTVTSVSTQKKKTRPQRLTQPYLNTQSCYKPKKEEAQESFSLSRQSYGGSKVRRQLYQTLDSPPKFGLETKENPSKNAKPKKKNTVVNGGSESRSTQIQDKDRKSLILPPNSIRNSFMNKPGTNVKPPGKQSGKTMTSYVNRQTKGTSRVTDIRKLKAVSRKSVFTKTEDDENTESDYSTPDPGDRQHLLYTRQDKFTMTSPAFSRGTFLSKSTCDLSKLERPSVIKSTSKERNASKYLNNTELPYLQMQNLNISNSPRSFSQNNQIHTQVSQQTEFNFSEMNSLDANNLRQFKSFLEQSIGACETQIENQLKSLESLKQVLSFVNTTLNNNKSECFIKSNENSNVADNLNVSGKFPIYHDESDATDIVEKSIELKNLTFEADALNAEDIAKQKHIQKISKVEDRLPIPIKVLVSDVDLKQEAKDLSLNFNEMVRLSTIGEVSCEADDSNKYEFENKENQCNPQNVTPVTPKTPKALARRLSCDSVNRRRSARLAAKQMSTTELDNHDSFTMLEKELNVERPIPSSKSLPASPMKPPTTPGVIRQWDKKVERPLKEYMALKMNGTFLVTPDVKRFQSCLELEPTDTPHSRKSLSRKIFMELCDLYAESPESK